MGCRFDSKTKIVPSRHPVANSLYTWNRKAIRSISYVLYYVLCFYAILILRLNKILLLLLLINTSLPTYFIAFKPHCPHTPLPHIHHASMNSPQSPAIAFMPHCHCTHASLLTCLIAYMHHCPLASLPSYPIALIFHCSHACPHAFFIMIKWFCHS